MFVLDLVQADASCCCCCVCLFVFYHFFQVAECSRWRTAQDYVEATPPSRTLSRHQHSFQYTLASSTPFLRLCIPRFFRNNPTKIEEDFEQVATFFHRGVTLAKKVRRYPAYCTCFVCAKTCPCSHQRWPLAEPLSLLFSSSSLLFSSSSLFTSPTQVSWAPSLPRQNRVLQAPACVRIGRGVSSDVATSN